MMIIKNKKELQYHFLKSCFSTVYCVLFHCCIGGKNTILWYEFLEKICQEKSISQGRSGEVKSS